MSINILSKLNKSILKKIIRKSGYKNPQDLADFFEGVRIEPERDIFPTSVRIYKHNKYIKSSMSINSLSKDVDKIYIVGSGPSIKTQNLAKLKNEKCILLNGALILAEQYGITPFMTVIVDRSFCLNRKEMLYKIPKGTKLVLSFSSLKEILLIDEQIIYDHDIYLLFPSSNTETAFTDNDYGVNVFGDVSYGILEAGTVMGAAIQVSATIKAKEIYLLGLDISNANTAPRFYETQQTKLKTGLLESYEKSTLPFMKLAKAYFTQQGINIYNCSPVSKLPYDIIPYNDIMEMPK